MTVMPHPTSLPPRRIALRAAWLYDGTTPALRPRPMVLLDGERIVAVAEGVGPPDDVEVVDLEGATLLPGLVDTHVHLVFDASADPVGALDARDDDAARDAIVSAARTAALGGVTTVRDLGDRGYLTLAMRGTSGLPTIVCAGPPLTTPGGHCHYLGGATERGTDAVRRAVRTHAERGVDVIKVMASGGLLTPGTREEQSQFTPDEMRAIVDEAHHLGLPVTAHAHGTPAIVDALAAGVDGLEHATFWADAGIESPEDVIAEIGARHLPIGATAGFAPAPDAPLDEDTSARLPEIIANVFRLHDAGATIVPGTDAGVHPSKPHDVVRYAVEQEVELGMPADETLRSATSVGAVVCGLGERKGRIAEGYDADVLAIDGDPLTEPSALHAIRAVFLRGERVR
jgi:imidazolonepropionase-like amidohydrolase